MKINISKTETTMVIAANEENHTIRIEGKELEQFRTFKYLGATINSTGTLEDEINERLAVTGRLYNAIKTTFLAKKEIPTETKAEVIRKVVKPTKGKKVED